jgi:hypothetical protein
MEKIIILLAVTILGGVGLGLGKHIGLGIAWFLSSIGSLVGVCIGWRIERAYLD